MPAFDPTYDSYYDVVKRDGCTDDSISRPKRILGFRRRDLGRKALLGSRSDPAEKRFRRFRERTEIVFATRVKGVLCTCPLNPNARGRANWAHAKYADDALCSRESRSCKSLERTKTNCPSPLSPVPCRAARSHENTTDVTAGPLEDDNARPDIIVRRTVVSPVWEWIITVHNFQRVISPRRTCVGRRTHSPTVRRAFYAPRVRNTRTRGGGLRKR